MNERLSTSEQTPNQEYNLTDKKFKKILGITQNHINRYENTNSQHGERNIDQEVQYKEFQSYYQTINALAKYFEKTGGLPHTWKDAGFSSDYDSMDLPILEKGPEDWQTDIMIQPTPADMAFRVGLINQSDYLRARRRALMNKSGAQSVYTPKPASTQPTAAEKTPAKPENSAQQNKWDKVSLKPAQHKKRLFPWGK